MGRLGRLFGGQGDCGEVGETVWRSVRLWGGRGDYQKVREAVGLGTMSADRDAKIACLLMGLEY